MIACLNGFVSCQTNRCISLDIRQTFETFPVSWVLLALVQHLSSGGRTDYIHTIYVCMSMSKVLRVSHFKVRVRDTNTDTDTDRCGTCECSSVFFLIVPPRPLCLFL